MLPFVYCNMTKQNEVAYKALFEEMLHSTAYLEVTLNSQSVREHKL